MLRAICMGVLTAVALAIASASQLAAAPKQSRAAEPAQETSLGSIVYAGWEWMMSPGRHAGSSPPGMPQRNDKGFAGWCRSSLSYSVDASMPFFMRDRAYCYRGR